MEGEWTLIESSPGIFTSLLHDLGATAVEVQELYTLDDLDTLDVDVHGVIFLFKWDQQQQQDQQPSPAHAVPETGFGFIDTSDMFFARQIIPNACATQAILNILMNTTSSLDIGSVLTQFKSFTEAFDPEMKGLAISNSDVIRNAHNSFARADPLVMERDPEESEKAKKEDVFHFTTYLPHRQHLFEVDGLKEGPVHLGPLRSPHRWLADLKPVLEDRIARYATSEIRFALMAVVGCKRTSLQENLNFIQEQLEALQEQNATAADDEILVVIETLQKQRADILHQLSIEEEKFERYAKENARRRHNFVPMICKMLNIMAEKNLLSAIAQEASQDAAKKSSAPASAGSSSSSHPVNAYDEDD